MKNQAQSHRVWRGGAALLLLLAAVLPAGASARRSEAWARSQFESAEKIRAALSQRDASTRSRHDYQQVIDAYRRIYFGSPSSSKADPSVTAVADLLLEMGRRFDDNALLYKAIRQYEFLWREYPGSKSRVEALLTIGEIYRDDLGDAARAKSTFSEFLQLYPHSHLADQARQALAAAHPAETNRSEKDKERNEDDSSEGSAATDSASGASAPEPAQPARKGNSPASLITGIHYSSFPGYTRVTIDLQPAGQQNSDSDPARLEQVNLQQSIKFESQRLSHPDRSYFDLTDSKLARGLNGKIIRVDDDFLTRIRVAQFARGRSRVVLEVKGESACDASVLADPPRMVIYVREQAGHGVLAGNQAPTGSANITMPSSQDLPGSAASLQAPKSLASAVGASPDAAAAMAGKNASQSAIKKTIVEADDDDADDVVVTSAANKRAARVPAIPAAERSQIRSIRSVHEAQPAANGERSLIRALGLKIGKIVIDPGHGGHDVGSIGPNGLTEKDLVLDVSLRLGKLLESRLGAEVDYTRDDDTFVPLESRTAIANQDQADLFVSVHANSSRDPDARGVETYYLNFTTSRDALDVAARENAVSDQSIYELQDLVKKIALKEKIEESREFAADVQSALHNGLSLKNPGLRDRGVKRAPFIVLIGANMPSILAEISFVSNPGDERKLNTPEYRERIAESLYRGIAKYVNGLSGIRVASKLDKSAGQ